MRPRLQHLFIPFLLFTISLLIRLLLISKGPYHSDALGFAVSVEQSVLLHKVLFLHGHGYPLSALLGIGFFWLLHACGWDNPVFAINLLSVIFSSGCVVLLYLLGRKLFDQTTALCAALVFTVSPIFLSVSVYGNSHTLSLFFFLCSLLALAHYQEKYRRILLYISAILLGLAGACRIQDLAVLLPAVVYFYWEFSPPGHKRKGKDFLLAAGIAFAVIALFYLPTFGGKTAVYNARLLRFSFLDPLSELFPPYFLGQTCLYLLENFHPLGVLLLISGLWLLAKKNCGYAIFLSLWILGPLLIFGNTFMTTPRWQTAGLVPASFFIAAPLAFVLRREERWARPVGLGVLFILVSLSLTKIYPVLSWRHDQQTSSDYARWIGQHTEPDAVIIVGDDGPFIRYYGKRTTLRQIVTDTDFFFAGKDLATGTREYKEHLDQLLAAETPVYITEIGLFSNNTGFFDQFLTHYYSLHTVGKTLFESWHRSCIKTTLLPVRLFKITAKDRTGK